MTKIALITGANRGLGMEIARQLSEQGMTVLSGARNAGAHFIPLDITDHASIAGAAAYVTEKFGHLDVLVNNAAIQSMEGQRPSEITPALLQELMQTNFMSQVAVTQAFLPLLLKSPAGRIVNMSTSLGSITIMSEPGHVNARRNLLGYSASKAALNMFTTLLAKELKDTPIKVNSADPGWTRTDLGGSDALYSVAEGARVAVWVAGLDAQGPTGGFFSFGKVNPW